MAPTTKLPRKRRFQVHHLLLPPHWPRFVSCKDVVVLTRAGTHFSLAIMAGCHRLWSHHPYNSSMSFQRFPGGYRCYPGFYQLVGMVSPAHHHYVDTDLHTYFDQTRGARLRSETSTGIKASRAAILVVLSAGSSSSCGAGPMGQSSERG